MQAIDIEPIDDRHHVYLGTRRNACPFMSKDTGLVHAAEPAPKSSIRARNRPNLLQPEVRNLPKPAAKGWHLRDKSGFLPTAPKSLNYFDFTKNRT